MTLVSQCSSAFVFSLFLSLATLDSMRSTQQKASDCAMLQGLRASRNDIARYPEC